MAKHPIIPRISDPERSDGNSNGKRLLVHIPDVPAQPCGKSMLVERTRSHFLHRFDSFGGINTQLTSVIGKKKTCKDPSSAFIAVRKAVVARKPGGVACRKRGRIRVAIRREILRSRKGRFDGAFIAHAVETAMLG